MTTFWTSDLHFGHARISELAGRPFGSVAEMDAELVARWNSVVCGGDTVYVLGDLVLGNLTESLERVRELNGLVLLVPGNHDRVSSLYKGSAQKKGEWAVAYREAGIRVMDEEFKTTIGADGVRVMVSHFPYEGDSGDVDRYAWSRPRDEGLPLLHGHTHSRERVRGRQIHVGVDAWDLAPVAEETLVELISKL